MLKITVTSDKPVVAIDKAEYEELQKQAIKAPILLENINEMSRQLVRFLLDNKDKLDSTGAEAIVLPNYIVGFKRKSDGGEMYWQKKE
jgi:DNA-binding transcriptional regulator/RsmH inhibitor MraZ